MVSGGLVGLAIEGQMPKLSDEKLLEVQCAHSG